MKVLKLVAFAFILITGSIFMTSCGNDTKKEVEMENVDKSGPEYTSAFVCPMHCVGSGSDEPGTCPVCNMEYVENKDAAHDHGSHDGHDHDGHDH